MAKPVATEEPTFKVYKRRWLMLFIVFFLNVSNGSLWLSFATITYSAADYFGVSANKINWFSLVFFITTVPFMFVALWVVDRFGFKPGVQMGCFLNAAGSIIRMMGTFSFVPKDSQYAVVLTGQIVASLAQPFAMSLLTKVSEVWFPQRQRALSTTIAALGNPLGLMLASVISAVTVEYKDDVPIPNEIYTAVGILAGLFGILVFRSKPPLPPSNSADKPEVAFANYSYFRNLKTVVTNKSFFVLMLAVGGGMGMVNCLLTLMDQILCSWGHSDEFAGICCAVMVIGGFIGAGLLSFIAEKTRRYEEIINIGYAITVLLAIIFTMIFRLQDIEYAIGIVISLLGFLAIGIYPICLEVGVETTYPIDESISTGAIVVVGQSLGLIFVLIMEVLEVPLKYSDQLYSQCDSESTEPADLIYSGLFLISVATCLASLMLLFFRPKYRRTIAETASKKIQEGHSIATIANQEKLPPDDGLL